MDAKTRARMDAKTREAQFYSRLAGASGQCVYEGDEYSPAVLRINRLDALWVAENPLGNSRAETALREVARRSRDRTELRVIADLFADEPSEAQLRSRIVRVERDVTDTRDLLPHRRFLAERASGAQSLMDAGIALDKRSAETEWMKRQAEWESGVSRIEADAAVRKKYEDSYDRLRAYDSR